VRTETTAIDPIPRWLRWVLISDRAGSSWYIGLGFFFAPALALVSPWTTVTALLWVLIGLFGLWLGLLGIAMATGLAMVLRAGGEIPEDYWWKLIGDKRAATPGANSAGWRAASESAGPRPRMTAALCIREQPHAESTYCPT
jgi:hypothetical protein